MGGDFMKNQDFHNYYNELEELTSKFSSDETKVRTLL